MTEIQEDAIVLSREKLEEKIGERITGTLISTLDLSPQSSWIENGIKKNLMDHEVKGKFVYWEEEIE